jgi:uncharacterized protein YgiM (DUF1202 family)
LVYLRDTSPEPTLTTWDIFRHDLRTGQMANISNTPQDSERQSAWEPVSGLELVSVDTLMPVVLRVQVSEASVNLRDGPSTNNAVVDQVPNGQTVFAQGVNTDRTWYYITVPDTGESAWVFANLVTVVEGDPGNLPVVEGQ